MSPYINGRRNQEYINPSLLSNAVFYDDKSQRSGTPVRSRAESQVEVVTPRRAYKGNSSNMEGILTPGRSVSPRPLAEYNRTPRQNGYDDQYMSVALPKKREMELTPGQRRDMTPRRDQDGIHERREAAPGQGRGANRNGWPLEIELEQEHLINRTGRRMVTPTRGRKNEGDDFDIISNQPKSASRTPERTPRRDQANVHGSTPRPSGTPMREMTPSHSHVSKGEDLLCPDCVNKYLMDDKKRQAEMEKQKEREANARLEAERQKEQEKANERLREQKANRQKETELLKKMAEEKRKERLARAAQNREEAMQGEDPHREEAQRRLEDAARKKRKELLRQLQEQIKDKERRDLQNKIEAMNEREKPMQFGNDYKNIFEGKQASFRNELKQQVEANERKKLADKENDKKLIEEENKAYAKVADDMKRKQAEFEKKQKDLFKKALEETRREKERRSVKNSNISLESPLGNRKRKKSRLKEKENRP